MPKSILTIISKDGNATEDYEKSVVTEHISKMEPLKEKFPKLYFYKFVIANLATQSRQSWGYFWGNFAVKRIGKVGKVEIYFFL